MKIANDREITPYQVLLAFVLHQSNTIAIPKASKSEHVVENAKAASIILTKMELEQLSVEFPKPKRKMYLDIV